MRIRTSAALRAVDKWKSSLSERYESTRHSIRMLSLAFRGSFSGAIVFFITAALVSFNFAGPAFMCLILFGVMKLRLNIYRLANQILLRLSRRSVRTGYHSSQ